jgi:hypothetical protein
MGASVADDSDTKQAWRDFLSDRDKGRLQKLEGEIKAQDDLVKAGEDKEAKMQAGIDALGENSKAVGSLKTELNRAINQTNKARDKRKSLQNALDKIKDVGVTKWKLRTEKQEREQAKHAEAKAQNALARKDTFILGPLTPEEALEKNRIEAEMTESYETMRTSGLHFADLLREIKEKHLYREHAGGFNEYCQKRWQLDRTFLFRQIQASEQIAGLRQLMSMKEQPITPDGKPVTIEVKEDELPNNEGHLRELRRYGPGKTSDGKPT